MTALPLAAAPVDEVAAQCVSCAVEISLENQSPQSRVLCLECEDGLFGRRVEVLPGRVSVSVNSELWTPGEVRRGSAFFLLTCLAVVLWFLSLVALDASAWFVPLIALDWALFLVIFLQEARRAQLSWEAERAATRLSDDVLSELNL